MVTERRPSGDTLYQPAKSMTLEIMDRGLVSY